MQTETQKFAAWLDAMSALRLRDGKEPLSATDAEILFRDGLPASIAAHFTPAAVQALVEFENGAKR